MNKSTQKRVLSGRDFNQVVFIAVPTFGFELKSKLVINTTWLKSLPDKTLLCVDLFMTSLVVDAIFVFLRFLAIFCSVTAQCEDVVELLSF